MQSESRLFWIDLEMTGLNPETDTILEIASVITTNDLEIIAEGPCLAIYQPESILEKMDEWCKEHHARSGLTADVQKSTISLQEACDKTLEFVTEYCLPRKTPLCGNSVHQDRAFMRRLMPTLNNYLHYRIIDISSVKELVQRWYPEDPAALLEKESDHRARADVYASIEELKHYRSAFFKS
jgi:oligoribonuclease